MWKDKYLIAYLHRNPRFERMRQYIEQHDKIADLGIAMGGAYYQMDIKEVVGVDLDGVLLGRVKEINPKVKTIKADVRKSGLPDKYYSLVVLSHILEHLVNYKPLIKEAKRICQDEGYFLIGLPVYHPSPTHFHPKWTENDVRELAKEFGNLWALHKIEGCGLDKSGYSTDNWLMYVKKT